MAKSKLSALVSLVFVFLSGVLVGVVAHRLYTVRTVAGSAAVNPPSRNPEEIRKRQIAEMRNRVKLDETQVVELNKIYDETRTDFDALHKKANAETRVLWDKQVEKIKAILRPDQIPLYDQLRAERDAERRRRHQNQPDRK